MAAGCNELFLAEQKVGIEMVIARGKLENCTLSVPCEPNLEQSMAITLDYSIKWYKVNL